MQYRFSRQSFVVFTCTQKPILKYNTVSNTKCMLLPSANKISMPQLFPWSRIEYNFLSKNLWICYSLSSASMVVWDDSKHFKGCNDILEVNLSHMHSMLLAPALLQHGHKKLIVNYDVFPGLFKSKRVLPWSYLRSISSAKLFALYL